jgi:thioredoxin-dependent peroxiredoxin
MAILRSSLVGQQAPDFTLESTQGAVQLSALLGQKVVLFFYPKDLTSGCTQEACDFNDNLERLRTKNVAVYGISKDSIKSHEKFSEKYNFNYPLISDPDGLACDAYGVWVEKSMYGKKYFGIERSTFVIDETGKIVKEWRTVKVPGHVDEVMAVL